MLNLAAFPSSSPPSVYACTLRSNATQTEAVNVACRRLSKKVILAALLTAVSAGQAFAQESRHMAFQFVNIADNTTGFTGFTSFPAINNRGAVVFQATGPIFTDGIFKAQNGEVTTVSSVSDGLIF